MHGSIVLKDLLRSLWPYVELLDEDANWDTGPVCSQQLIVAFRL